MMEEVLRCAEDVESLSFYGLTHWLSEVDNLIAKRNDDGISDDHTGELVAAQARLRRAMGARLENPSLTEREKSQACDFLEQQIAKISVGTDARAARMIEHLRRIHELVKTTPPLPMSQRVRDTEVRIKALETEWKELSPLHERWQAGRHSFRSNADLQTFVRQYNECQRARAAARPALTEALCARHDGIIVEEPQPLPKDWAAVARTSSQTSHLKATRPPPPPTPAPPPRGNGAWASAGLTLAQRMRAEISASIRAECIDKPLAPDSSLPANTPAVSDGFWQSEDSPDASAPMPLSSSLEITHSVDPSKTKITVGDNEGTAVLNEPTVDTLSSSQSPKKKGGKAAKKRGGLKSTNEDGMKSANDAECRPNVGRQLKRSEPKTQERFKAALDTIVEAFHGSALELFATQEAWSLPNDEHEAAARFQELAFKLPWTSPLGLPLPLEWKQFASLQMDGGPKRTSRRGRSEFALRLQKNIPWLCSHYITFFFAVLLLHALSQFGALFWAFLGQATLLLAPPGVPHLTLPRRVLMLQSAQALLWILLVRVLWMLHFFLKCGMVILVIVHAYLTAPLDGD